MEAFKITSTDSSFALQIIESFVFLNNFLKPSLPVPCMPNQGAIIFLPQQGTSTTGGILVQQPIFVQQSPVKDWFKQIRIQMDNKKSFKIYTL